MSEERELIKEVVDKIISVEIGGKLNPFFSKWKIKAVKILSKKENFHAG